MRFRRKVDPRAVLECIAANGECGPLSIAVMTTKEITQPFGSAAVIGALGAYNGAVKACGSGGTWVIVLLAGCATSPVRSAPSEERRSPPTTETAARPSVEAASSGPPTAPPRAAEEPGEGLGRLGWVNPARCLSSCTYDPSASLVRIDDQGVPDADGPHQVHRSIQEPLHALVAAAREAGHAVRLTSAFRSYADQARLYRGMKQIGRAARPGHSEHQLGTAVDLRLPTSAAIGWLAEHAAAHGFALSYPEGKQRITGYRPEPWHLRFVGAALAEALRQNGQTLEELFRARPDRGESGNCEDCPLAISRPRCGAVTAAGRCKGKVLQWCYDGALATVDCAVSHQRCGVQPDAGDYGCLGP